MWMVVVSGGPYCGINISLFSLLSLDPCGSVLDAPVSDSSL